MQVLSYVRDVRGLSDIIAELDRPAKEGLVEINSETCSFVHDMIQHSVQLGTEPKERTSCVKEIAETLLARTTGNSRTDAILFILVDLINRVGPPEGASTVDRMRYAGLNLLAGEKVCWFVNQTV